MRLHFSHILIFLFISAASTIGTAVIHAEHAHAAAPIKPEPLVIIRFDQSRVSFDRQLYSAISRAAQIKPALTVDVVSFVPVAPTLEQQQKRELTAANNAEKVRKSLSKIGIPAQQINLIQQLQPGILHDEAHIFVR